MVLDDMGLTRQHSKSRIYFISAAVVSENWERRMLQLKDRDRAYLMHKLKCYATFCGVDVLSFSILPNHFYAMVQVREKEDLTDEMLIYRLKAIYKPDRVDLERGLLKDARENDDDALAKKLRAKFTSRMWNVSRFMQELQVHFAKWYNDKYAREGRLWECLFRSTIVKDDHYEIGAIAAYIELAAVREKLVHHPAHYEYASLAAAIDGDESARIGIKVILGTSHVSWKNLLNRFLYWLFLHCGKEHHGTSAGLKRHVHEVKTKLLEKRSREDILNYRSKVARGETDYPLASAMAKLLLAPVTLMEEIGNVHRHLQQKPVKNGDQEDEISVLRMRLCDFQLNYKK